MSYILAITLSIIWRNSSFSSSLLSFTNSKMRVKGVEPRGLARTKIPEWRRVKDMGWSEIKKIEENFAYYHRERPKISEYWIFQFQNLHPCKARLKSTWKEGKGKWDEVLTWSGREGERMELISQIPEYVKRRGRGRCTQIIDSIIISMRHGKLSLSSPPSRKICFCLFNSGPDFPLYTHVHPHTLINPALAPNLFFTNVRLRSA